MIGLLLLWACSRSIPTPPGDDGHYERIEVAGAEDRFRGLSGAAPGPDDTIWVVPEQTQYLVRMNIRGQPVLDGAHAVSLAGIPGGHDIESLAFLSKDRFVVGLEGFEKDRHSDPVLWMRRLGDTATVEETHPLYWGLWNGLTVKKNHGIEGACYDGESLWVAGEPTGRLGERRFAPLARWDEEAQEWEPHQLLLTSEKGKISSLDCRFGKATAIERHYGVQHVLSFELEGTTIDPTVIARPGQDGNYEGIVTSGSRVILVGDNNYRRKKTPTWVVRFER